MFINLNFLKTKRMNLNKLTTSILITQNNKVYNPINMTIFKSTKYLCIWIWNVDDIKVID